MQLSPFNSFILSVVCIYLNANNHSNTYNLKTANILRLIIMNKSIVMK